MIPVSVNHILFRRKNKILIDSKELNNREKIEHSKPYAISLMKNLETYGYTIDQNLFDVLLKIEVDEYFSFYNELITEIKVLTGADKTYSPMYPNFPRQVMDADDSELYINALIHYWSDGTLLPDYEKEERFPLVTNTKLKVIGTGTNQDLYDIENNLLSSKTNISQQDKEDLKYLLERFPSFPKEIPNKEILAFYCCCGFEFSYPLDLISGYIKTTTDLLRIVTCWSNGDISLATNTKFIKLKRKQRKFIVDALERIGNSAIEDMFRYRERWLRIGEIVHPSEYCKKYPEQYKSVDWTFRKLRENDKPLFWGGKVEENISNRFCQSTVDLLVLRPSEFGRRLDYLLRTFASYQDRKYILDKFANKAALMSTGVLWGILEHFKTRKNNDYRVFFPKGNTAKFYAIDNNLGEIKESDVNSVITTCRQALLQKYIDKKPLGKVYIDNELKNYTIPFSQRSASSGSKILTRGSKLPIGDSNIIRGFIWWTNTEKSRVDLDLSAGIYDDDMQLIKHISYTNLKSDSFKAYHSGDIVNGGDVDGEGVAEFIDIDINEVAKNARYIVFQVYSFTRQPFNTLSHSSFGWMSRTDYNSGEIFEPKTVENLIDINSNSVYCVPVIFDCKEKKAIWCDIAFNPSNSSYHPNNLEYHNKDTNYVLYAMTHLNKPNLYDLCTLNSLARGSIVSKKEEADIIFSSIPETYKRVEKKINPETFETKTVETEIPVITPYDIDYIVGDLL